MQSRRQEFAYDTYLWPEELAYPSGGQKRPGAAIYPDGIVRKIRAGIPDTYFSIPAHGRMYNRYLGGYVSVDDRLLSCEHCHGNYRDGCGHCTFGLVDSPTKGALLFHPNLESIRKYNEWISQTRGDSATLGDFLIPFEASRFVTQHEILEIFYQHRYPHMITDLARALWGNPAYDTAKFRLLKDLLYQMEKGGILIHFKPFETASTRWMVKSWTSSPVSYSA